VAGVVGVALPEGEVVHFEHPHLPGLRQCRAFGPREQGVAPDDEAELGDQLGAGAPAQLQDDREQSLRQPSRLSDAGRDVGQSLAEDFPLAGGFVAEEAPGTDLERHRDPMPGQVREVQR
jgi:hypothetical protein